MAKLREGRQYSALSEMAISIEATSPSLLALFNQIAKELLFAGVNWTMSSLKGAAQETELITVKAVPTRAIQKYPDTLALQHGLETTHGTMLLPDYTDMQALKEAVAYIFELMEVDRGSRAGEQKGISCVLIQLDAMEGKGHMFDLDKLLATVKAFRELEDTAMVMVRANVY